MRILEPILVKVSISVSIVSAKVLISSPIALGMRRNPKRFVRCVNFAFTKIQVLNHFRKAPLRYKSRYYQESSDIPARMVHHRTGGLASTNMYPIGFPPQAVTFGSYKKLTARRPEKIVKVYNRKK